MARCVLLGGAPIGVYEEIRRSLLPDDFVIACDSGLNHCAPLQITPQLIIGDFDSHEKPDTAIETIVLPHEKDDTDLMFAAKEGIRRGFSDFLLLGAAGGRLDHTLGNLAVLLWLYERGAKACLLDDYADMEIVGSEKKYVASSYPYFSLLNISGPAGGVNIQHAKFALLDADLSCSYPLGVSNEVLPGKEAEISVRTGNVLLIKIRHE